MQSGYRSIFTPGTPAEREANFETYYAFTRRHSGDLIEEDRDLSGKRALLRDFSTIR